MPTPELMYVTPAGLTRDNPAESATPVGPSPAADRGLWVAGSLGIGAPFGASPFVPLSQGLGLHASVGWSWNFVAAVAFLQLDSTAVSGDAEGSGRLFLGGVEVRGILGAAAPVKGWLGLGLSMGGGVLEDARADASYEADFGPLPSVSLGVAVRVLRGLRVGPQVNWYLLSVSRACEEREQFGQVVRSCSESFDEWVIPDLLYLGLGASWTGTS